MNGRGGISFFLFFFFLSSLLIVYFFGRGGPGEPGNYDWA